MSDPTHSVPRASRLRRRAALLAGALAAGALLVLAGPRPRVDTTLYPLALPGELSALEPWLTAREASVADLRSGCAARVVWADPQARARTPVALVYLHGFSASPAELSPLCEQVAAALGANLYLPRLTGHGRPGAALAAADVGDWLNDAHEALAIGRLLGERVVLVGTSTGGALASWLAARPEGRDVAALVLLSPNFRVRHPAAGLLAAPWGEQLARLLVGPERSWTPRNAAHGQYWTTRYPVRAAVTLGALLALVEDTDLGAVRAPLLLVHSLEDRVVDGHAAAARFADFGSPLKRRVELDVGEDPDHHLLAGDVLSPSGTAPLAALLLEFLRPLLGEEPPP